LQHPNLDPQFQTMLQIMEDSAQRGANLVRQILTFARCSEGVRVPVQIDKLLQEIAKVIQQTFPKSIVLQSHFAGRALSSVLADPTHLHQVLMNLCINARDAMPNGGTLTLSAQNSYVDQAFAQMQLDAHVGHYVVITVGDTGTGIPLELRDRIFEPFFTTKKQGEGTGLGLATSLGIVRSYGGFVQVVSEVGQGSQFKVYLPMNVGEAGAIEPTTPLLRGHGELVLIVEDDPALQITYQTLLEHNHYQTLAAADGLAALLVYAQRQLEIRAVVMDLVMPNFDGVNAIQTLISINPQVQILAVSGLVAKREAALAAGAKRFLAKPYTLEELLQNLHDLVRGGV
jgi:CheY-like chemotaxis protein